MKDLFKIKNECAVCETAIWQFDGVKRKKTKDYREATVQLDNLSQMVVGVCPAHSKLNKKDLPMVEAKTKQGWLEEVALGIGNEQWVQNSGTKLRVVGIGG